MKKILLLSPDFYSYWRIIKNGIEKEGYFVDTIIYPHSFFYKLCGLYTLTKKVVSNYDERFYRKKICQLRENVYEKVIIIKSSVLPVSVLYDLKNTFSKSTFISYIWDDLRLDKNEITHFSFFDKIFSFSIDDCEQYQLQYRPMFYNNLIGYPICKKNIDLFYIGSYRYSRFTFLKKILNSNKYSTFRLKFILRASVFLFLLKTEHYRYIRLFTMRPVPYTKMLEYMLRTKCAVELETSGQTGLTTRPIECIATRTKIITTNQNIKKYSLYNPNNVLVVDINNPEISKEWINSPYKDLPEEIRDYYTLTRFVKDILA